MRRGFLLKNTKSVGVRLNRETDRRLEIACAKLDIRKSDAVEAAVRLFLEVLENPGVINIDGIRDAELRGFLSHLLGRRERG